MNTDVNSVASRMYALLPAVYRLRDAEQGYPLRDLVTVIAEQVAVVQEGLEQSYDNLFIETCAEWVIPYIGDLIGARSLHGKAPGVGGGRTEVADTLGLRRRKGTLAALEQSARAVTGYPAVAVEFFERLSVSQHTNHPRPTCRATVNMRDELALERVDGPFDSTMRTVEVRRIAAGRGRYNIPNIGIYLFRLQSLAISGASAARIDDFRYTFSPLGIDEPLWSSPRSETAITQFAGPENVPLPISRLAMKRELARFYGPDAAMLLEVDGAAVPIGDVRVCNLSDLPGSSGDWAHAPADHYAIDPMLGRIAVPTSRPAPQRVVVRYFRGFSDTIGGGAYERGRTIAGDATQTVGATAPDVQAALAAAESGGIVEFSDSRSYRLSAAAPHLDIADGMAVEIRAANGQRPVLQMDGGDLEIRVGRDAKLTINGLVITGGALRITGEPASVVLRHCTLVPGIARTRQNQPAQPGVPSLIVAADGVSVELDACITGAIQIANGSSATITRSVVDADDDTAVCFDGGGGPGGVLRAENSTLIGRVHAQQIERASNVLFIARAAGPAALPVRSERTQEGCVRFSVIPAGSRTPRRHRCVALPVRFTSLRFGTPGYCQLSSATTPAVRRGADDESEIGVFHDLFQPQRESDLRTRLDEYLRFGMEAGIYYAS